MSNEKKEPLKGLFRDNKDTPEGKYLVKRRDGTVVEWPSFVLGARDPDGSATLLFYGLLKLVTEDIRNLLVEQIETKLTLWMRSMQGQNKEFVASIQKWANLWDEYRKTHGDGDPLMGRHRKDDPATIEEMKKGYSA